MQGDLSSEKLHVDIATGLPRSVSVSCTTKYILRASVKRCLTSRLWPTPSTLRPLLRGPGTSQRPRTRTPPSNVTSSRSSLGGFTALHAILTRAIKPLPNGLKPTYHSVIQTAVKMHYLGISSPDLLVCSVFIACVLVLATSVLCCAPQMSCGWSARAVCTSVFRRFFWHCGRSCSCSRA